MINLTQNFAELLDVRSHASLNKFFDFNCGNSGFPYQPTAFAFIDLAHARVMALQWWPRGHKAGILGASSLVIVAEDPFLDVTCARQIKGARRAIKRTTSCAGNPVNPVGAPRIAHSGPAEVLNWWSHFIGIVDSLRLSLSIGYFIALFGWMAICVYVHWQVLIMPKLLWRFMRYKILHARAAFDPN